VLYTVEIEYAAMHLLHIKSVHTMRVQKSFCFQFNFSVWMNTFFLQFVKLCINVQLSRQCCENHGTVTIYII